MHDRLSTAQNKNNGCWNFLTKHVFTHTHTCIYILLIYVGGACRGAGMAAVLAFYFYTELAGLLVFD